MRLLKRTQRGPDVGRWQHFLIDQGLHPGAITRASLFVAVTPGPHEPVHHDGSS